MKEYKKPLEWYTENRKVSELVPYEYNPRKLSKAKKEKLIASLEKFNLAEIPVINTDNVLVAGHQRIYALIELGRGEEIIDVRVPSRPLTEEELKEYNLRSNLSYGEWDLDLLNEHFEDLDFEDLGFDPQDLKIPSFDFLKDYSQEIEPDTDLTPAENPISQPGDVIELISLDKNLTHKIICEDSTKKETYQKILQDQSVDLIVTDPPYNVNYEGKTKEKLTIQNDNMSSGAFFEFLNNVYKRLSEVSKPGAGIYVFHADSEWNAFRTNFVQNDFYLAQSLVWKKQSFVLGRQDYHWIHEPILYGWKKGGPHTWHGDRKQSTVLEFNKPERNGDHPTMKPLDILAYIIKNSSRQEQLVLDAFLGSGSTLLACEQTWRQCRGVELDPKYMDVIIRRWTEYMELNDLNYKILINGQEKE